MSCCYESRHPQDDGMTAILCLVPALDNNTIRSIHSWGEVIQYCLRFTRPWLQGQQQPSCETPPTVHCSMRICVMQACKEFSFLNIFHSSLLNNAFHNASFGTRSGPGPVLLLQKLNSVCSLFFSHQFKVKNFNKWSHEQNTEDQFNLTAVNCEKGLDRQNTVLETAHSLVGELFNIVHQ